MQCTIKELTDTLKYSSEIVFNPISRMETAITTPKSNDTDLKCEKI